MYPENSVIECQICGTKLRDLNHREAQMVANNPYNYILYCTPCAKEEQERRA
jgi:hypothetical protein